MRGRLNRPLALAVLAVFVLVGVVAVASTGSTPGGTSDTRPPGELLLDTFFSLALVALVPGAALLIYGLMQRKEIAEEIASGRYRRSTLATLIFFAFLLGLAVYFGLKNKRFAIGMGGADVVDIGSNEQTTSPGGDPGTGRLYEAEFAWIPVAIVVGLLVLAVLAFVLASRRRRVLADEDAAVAEQLADVLDETLDDLRAEPDARRAVIAAYARLERAFAAAGLPRRRHETAEEYVPRVLGGLEVDEEPVRTLTDLFEAAKFSHHVVSDEMKLSAVAALERIRDDLRAAAARAEEPLVEDDPAERAATS